GHPDFRNLDPDLDTVAVAVIGNANVAIDCARVLVKTRAEMAASDIPDYALDPIQRAPIADVYMFGRRGPVEAKFTNVELREFGDLENCTPVVDPGQLPDKITGEMSDRDRRLREKNLATLRGFTAMTPDGKAKRVHFAFFAKPVEILGKDKVERLRLERTRVVDGRAVDTGEFFEIPCGLVIAAIGYYAEPLDGVPFDKKQGIAAHTDGRVAPGIYAVGWIKRGPTGVIGTNKPDGHTAAEQILADTKSPSKPGREALEALLRAKGVRSVSYRDWQTIDRAEVAAAPPGAPRRKFARVADMLALLDSAR
ncbi:MAG: FAD-dependent oxidoreductase, partial [Alphaproteobacteria bacterium]